MSNLMIVALTMTIGYLLGRVKVKGLSLGTSGILLAALVLGHFGFVVSPDIKNIGLACFVTAVGIIAGPTFFENFKKGALQYIFLGFLTIGIGAAVCVAVIKISGLPTPLALGLLNGALTSTPGLAAALEATGDPIASVGYGIAYPFGVLGVVLFVQVLPTLLKTDVRGEVAELHGYVYAAGLLDPRNAGRAGADQNGHSADRGASVHLLLRHYCGDHSAGRYRGLCGCEYHAQRYRRSYPYRLWL